MGYKYEDERQKIFTDKGQREFLATRDRVLDCLEHSGSFMMGHVLPTGDAWFAMALIDRMVELGEIKEISAPGTWGQHRVFVSSRSPF